MRLPFAPLWLALPALLVLWYAGTQAGYQTDLWHSLAAGREMYESGHLVELDRQTFTIAASPVHNQPWLAQLAMYGLARAGGRELVHQTAAILYAAAWLLVTLSAWRRCGEPRVATATAIAAMALAASNFSVRTQMFSVPLAAVQWYALAHCPSPWRLAAVVVAVEALWANVHGAFPLGVILPGLFLAGAVLAARPAWSLSAILTDVAVGRYAIASIIAAAAMFLNPHPAATLDYVFGVAAVSSTRGLDEWRPIGLATPTGWLFFASVLFATLIMLGGSRRAKNVGSADWLVLLAFGVLASRAERMVIWWALVLPPILAPRLMAIVGGWLPEEEPRSLGTLPVALLLAAITAVSTPWTRAYNPLLLPEKRIARPADEPWQAAEFLGGSTGPARLFNTMEWGGYLRWIDPSVRVFIDPRLDFYPDAVWNDYLAAGNAAPGWQEILDHYRVDRVVWNRQLSEALPRALAGSNRWKQVYGDSLAVVFDRADQPATDSAATTRP